MVRFEELPDLVVALEFKEEDVALLVEEDEGRDGDDVDDLALSLRLECSCWTRFGL